MKQIIMLAALLTSACTIAVNDPEKFEKVAVRETKTYTVARDDLWRCFVMHVPPSGADITYQTEKEFVYKTSGIALVKFRKHERGTSVLAETAPNGWETPKRYLDIADRCETKGNENGN